MAQNAEQICAESESNKAKIEARNGLKSIGSFAHTLSKEKPRDKLEGSDKEKTEAAVQGL